MSPFQPVSWEERAVLADYRYLTQCDYSPTLLCRSPSLFSTMLAWLSLVISLRSSATSRRRRWTHPVPVDMWVSTTPTLLQPFTEAEVWCLVMTSSSKSCSLDLLLTFLLREFIGLLLPMSPTWSVCHWRKISCLLLSDVLLLHRGWRNWVLMQLWYVKLQTSF